MMLWDPNNLDAELDGADARLNWGNCVLGSGTVAQNVVGRLARREAAARAEVAQRFLDEKTAGIQIAEVSMPSSQALRLTAAALRFFGDYRLTSRRRR